MSNLKHDALTAAGIQIGDRVPLPPDLIPEDAQVEIEAKKAAGYFTPDGIVENLETVVGRDLEDY
jgi:GTP cyclohydrolase II